MEDEDIAASKYLMQTVWAESRACTHILEYMQCTGATIEEGRVRQRGVVRQMKSADQSAWAQSRARTTILYRPDFARTD